MTGLTAVGRGVLLGNSRPARCNAQRVDIAARMHNTKPSTMQQCTQTQLFCTRKCQVSERIEMGRVTQRGTSMLSQPVRAQCCDLDGGPWQKTPCNCFTAAPHGSCCSDVESGFLISSSGRFASRPRLSRRLACRSFFNLALRLKVL